MAEPPHPSFASSELKLVGGVNADRLPPVAAAGVMLAKIVLGMVMASILLLTLYLILIDLNEGSALGRAYEGILRQASLGTPASADQVRIMGELAKQIGEQRQAFRTFWLQTAQLVLLNLLLPLVTALLGYIFGTTQVARNGRGSDD
jgi:hypothetical protein